MRILLDSHIFIWAVTGEQHRLSPAQRNYYSGGAGDQSWEEMLAGFVDVVMPAGDDPGKLLPPKKAKGSE